MSNELPDHLREIENDIDLEALDDADFQQLVEAGLVRDCTVGGHWTLKELNALPPITPRADPVAFCENCSDEALEQRALEVLALDDDPSTAADRIEQALPPELFTRDDVEAILRLLRKEQQEEADLARLARGEFALGPILSAAAERLAAAAREEFGEPVVDSEVEPGWWIESIDLNLDGDGVLAALADTPDVLACQLSFDDLYEDYAVAAVTPGWMIGEAATRIVRDAARKQLGLPLLYEPREG